MDTIQCSMPWDGQIAARGPNVARHSVFSSPQKHSGKSSNLKVPPTYSKY